MYTALEPSPAQAVKSNIMMANTSSTLCSSKNSGSGLVSTNSPSNLSFYDRPLRSPLQSVHTAHHLSNQNHSSSNPNPPPIPLSPPIHLTSSSTNSLNPDLVIKSSPSPVPTPGMVTSESVSREDESDNFTSSSCLYNLDTVQTTVGSPASARTDQLLRASNNIYLQNCGGNTPQTSMDINASSDIPSSLLMPSEYNNHYSLSGHRTSVEDQSSQLSNHHYPSRFSTLHPNTNPLDLHEHQKRINNNNNLVREYNVVPPSSSAAAFTPSPSSDSHCESPTTPKMHSLSSGTKETALLCSINGNGRHLGPRDDLGPHDEREMLSPSAINTNLIQSYQSTTATNFMGGGMVDIGVGKGSLSTIHSKNPTGKNGHGMDNGSSTSLTPPNSATHLRKDCSGGYVTSHLTHIPTMSNNDELMLDVSEASNVVSESFANFGNQQLDSSLGMSKRMSYASPTMPGTTTGNSTLYSKSTTSSLSPVSASVSTRVGSDLQRGGNFVFTNEQIDCISDSLQQRRDYRMLENFLHEYSSNDLSGSSASNNSTTKNGNGNSESVVRGMAAVAYENGNYRELYQIIESRDFDPAHHEELQRIWYEAHYKEAEGVRGRPLGKLSI